MIQVRLSSWEAPLSYLDRALTKNYGFNEEELELIINYDIKYRMGRDATVDRAERRMVGADR